MLLHSSPGAVVGLEQTFFRVEENVGFIEVCVNVSFPDIECPIEFPFQVELSTVDGTAGKIHICALCSRTFSKGHSEELANLPAKDTLLCPAEQIKSHCLSL